MSRPLIFQDKKSQDEMKAAKAKAKSDFFETEEVECRGSVPTKLDTSTFATAKKRVTNEKTKAAIRHQNFNIALASKVADERERLR